ncbi:hypothetical protein [Neisseria sp. Marseille-Q2251]|uniref:hypothetical protein n=1 Tax=Neisseria sp. Marseille-Q2251 TaxID=2866585 RepID=UPI00313867E7
MDNSNENTQNPKENQEKTAEKGSQEHSEHTAKNKQPESKDNAQKRNESTRLCKFFKKIKEWICASENRNSKKTYENAAKNDDAAKQEEIKQAETVEQPKEQRKLSDYLEIISKIFGISAIFGTFIGGSFIYNYLKNIGQLSIFPDVVTNPYALIAATIVFGFILLCFITQFILTFLYGYIKEYKTIPYKNVHILMLFFLFLSFFSLGIYIISLFTDDILIIIVLIAFVSLFNFIFVLLGSLTLKQRIEKNILTATIFTAILLIPIILIPNSNSALSFASNHFVRFAESSGNSSWYLLHNNFQQNNGSQETNGIDKNDLIKLKQNFKCSILSEKEKAEKNIECSSIPEQRNNALYGYMAWNLGDTKFFCPATTDNTEADFTKDKGTKEREAADKIAEECIIISGKALQIMPENYLSTNTDGIDDSNPDNTGHDDPTIDIKTDVKFKNDLNAQSNAGLNNFNIQPVLPIQSNAKNMSIQIHYGSCNHDSPRNKDGHPDIGYTDKKICQ